MHQLSWLEAIVIGALQGVSELFPVFLARPLPTAVFFLVVNGLILLGAEALRRRAASEARAAHPARAAGDGRGAVDAAAGGTTTMRAGSAPVTTAEDSDERLGRIPVLRAVGIGTAQIAALCPQISRSGVTMATGLLRGLSHEDAARFSFLLSTPVILAAGVLKLGDLAGPLGDGVRPQILVGSLLSFVGAYLSVRFLTRYFENRSLRPFGIYCLVGGGACLVWFGIR